MNFSLNWSKYRNIRKWNFPMENAVKYLRVVAHWYPALYNIFIRNGFVNANNNTNELSSSWLYNYNNRRLIKWLFQNFRKYLFGKCSGIRKSVYSVCAHFQQTKPFYGCHLLLEQNSLKFKNIFPPLNARRNTDKNSAAVCSYNNNNNNNYWSKMKKTIFYKN